MSIRPSFPSLGPRTLGRGVLAPAVALLLVLAFAFAEMRAASVSHERATASYALAEEVHDDVDGALIALLDAQFALRSQLVSGSAAGQASWREARRRFARQTRAALRLEADDPAERVLIAELIRRGDAYLSDYGQGLVARRARGALSADATLRALSEGAARLDAIRDVAEQISRTEMADNRRRAAAARRAGTRAELIAVAALAVALLLVCVLLAFVARRVVGPIRTLHAATRRMAGGELGVRVEPTPVRELADMGTAFNALGAALAERDAMIARHTETLEAQVRERTYELEAERIDSLRRLAIASEYRDDDTHEHTERVARTSYRLAVALGLPAAATDLLHQAAGLHDVGKIGVPDHVLRKPGRLDDEERAVMERHTLIGADILSGSESPVLTMAEQIALSHHERWDGGGYPCGLAGTDIPLSGRIVAVADVFDALTHVRPYKDAWSIERAVAHISEQSGRHFDPEVVAAFLGLDHAALLERISAEVRLPGRDRSEPAWRADARSRARGAVSEPRAAVRARRHDRSVSA